MLSCIRGLSSCRRAQETSKINVEKLPEVSREEKEDPMACYWQFWKAVINKNETLINLIISKDGMPRMIFEDFKETLLHIVARFGTANTAQQLIKHGADVNAQNFHGETPLFIAPKNSTEMVKILLNNGADVNILFEESTGPLHEALYLGSEEAIQLIIKKGLSKIPNNSIIQNQNLTEDLKKDLPKDLSENFTSDKFQNRKKVVELMLNHKTELNLTKRDYPLLLFFAARVDDEDIFNLILQDYNKSIDSILKGKRYQNDQKDRNHQGYFGRTALHYAVKEQLPEVVRFLLNHGADVNPRTSAHYTPLHYAASLENLEICKILLSFGAHVNVKTLYIKETPLFQVCGRSEARNLLKSGDGYYCPLLAYYYPEFHNHFIIRIDPPHEPKPIFNLEIMEFLLKSGADPEIPKIEGTTPVLEACRAGRMEPLKLLLSFGANLRSVDDDKNTALHHAAAGGSFEIVDFLLKNGFGIDIKNEDEFTLLHYVTQCGNINRLAMIEYFVDCGVNINAKNRNGATALHIAGFVGDADVVECLLELGAEVKLKYNKDCQPVMGTFWSGLYGSGGRFGQEVLAAFIALKKGKLGGYIHFYVEFYEFKDRDTQEVYSYFKECKLELERLKARRIFEHVEISFYDFLTRDFLSATEIVKNEEIRRVLDSGDYKEEFPCYKLFLQKRFERIKALEDSVEKTVDFIKKHGEVKSPIFVSVQTLNQLCAKDFRILGKFLSESKE